MATSDAPAATTAATTVVSRHPLVTAAVAVALVVSIVRWWITRPLRVFALIPDEAAQLAMARTLAGDRWSMLDYSTFRPGFSILISPIWWFADDPATGLAGVWVANALLGGLAAALYVVAARRLTDLGVVASALAALAVALGPALLFTTRFAWAEALVQPVVVGFVLALLAFGDRPTLGRGVLTMVLAALGFLVHSRLLPLSFVALGLVVALAARRRLARRTGVLVLAVAVASLAAASLIAGAVVDLTWTHPFTTNSFRGALGQWRQAGSMFATAVGHLWYQLAASLGLAGLGAWTLLRPRRGARASRRDGVLVVVTVVALMALSVAFLAGRPRPDRLVYGRYTDPASALLVIAGLAAVARHRALAARRLLTVAAGTILTAVALIALRGEELRATGVLRAMILGLQAVMWERRTIPVAPATVVAVVAMLVFAVVSLAPRRVRSTLLVGGLATGILFADIRVHDLLNRARNARLDAGDVTELVAGDDPLLPPWAAVRLRVVERGVEVGREGQRQRAQLYQYFLPGHRFDLDGAEPSPTPYVIAPSDDPGLAATPGAELLWQEPGEAIGLWYVPTG